ncbi:MAG: hypothetical protein II897_04085 [Clostridia bacterium]|nr:hypothetical protein [Clostridia bacterium]
MKEVKNELYCRECGHTHITEHREYECPDCGSSNVYNCSFITCDCGETVYLSGHTIECECGKLYNGFGQELAPVEEWEPEDRYGCFGPQNACYDY